MKKRNLKVMAMMAAAVLALSGCSGGGNTATEAPKSDSSEAATEAAVDTKAPMTVNGRQRKSSSSTNYPTKSIDLDCTVYRRRQRRPFLPYPGSGDGERTGTAGQRSEQRGWRCRYWTDLCSKLQTGRLHASGYDLILRYQRSGAELLLMIWIPLSRLQSTASTRRLS